MYYGDLPQWLMNVEDVTLLARALALRKQRKIGILWVDADRVWISASEYDPFGSRVRVSISELRSIVEAAEALAKKAPQKEIPLGSKKTIAS